MTNVYVRYTETHAGRTAIRYAFDFAKLYSGEPLNILVACDSVAEASLSQAVPELVSAVRAAVRTNVQELVGVADAAVTIVPYEEHGDLVLPADAVYVDAEALEDAQFHCLHPAHETQVEGRRQGPVLVTFSDGITGLVAANAAFELIQCRRAQRQTMPQSSSDAEVIFYHTTWQDPDAPTCDPVDHMCEAATRVMLAMQAAADEQDIRWRTIVQTERDVAQGVLKTANKNGCVMIVMDRSEQVSQGSYVDRILEQSAIPVFVAAPHTEPLGEPAPYSELAEFYRDRRVTVAPAAAGGSRWIHAIANSSLFSSPLFVMSVTALMYVYKSLVKVSVGLWVNSPTVLADGLHNIADLMQAVVVAIVNKVSKRPSSQRYPWGLKNIESFASLVIGLALFATAFKFALDCFAGLLSYWPSGDHLVRLYIPLPAVEISNMTAVSFPWVLAVGISSVVLSLLVSRYEILVGKRSGHASMIADGEETRSDGWIEAITIIGIVAEFASGWRIIEYPLGLLVAWMIRGTAWELFLRGWRVLLQHSLGLEREATLREAAMSIAGVIGVPRLKTFQVGNEAVVMITIDTLARSARLPYVKESVENALRACLLDPADEFKSVDVSLQFNRPDAEFRRIGYAVCLSADGEHDHVAPSLVAANALAVCDVERGEVVRTKVVSLSGKDIASLLLEKRLHVLYVLDPIDEATHTLVTQMRARAARTRQAHLLPVTAIARPASYTMSPLGVTLRRTKSSKQHQTPNRAVVAA